MAGLDRKKLIVKVSLVFTIGYFFMLLPKFPNESYQNLIQLELLNYDIFDYFGYGRFAIEFIILYILHFYFVYHSQISVLSESASYLSMVFNSLTKKTIMKRIYIECLIDNGIVVLVSSLCVFLIAAFSTFIIGNDATFCIESIIHFVIFDLKIIVYIYGMTVASCLMMFVNSKNNLIYYSYGGFFAFILLDYGFNTAFYRMTSNIDSELIWLAITLLIALVIILIASLYFKQTKEIYND